MLTSSASDDDVDDFANMCVLLSMTVEMKRDWVNFNLMLATMLCKGDDDDNDDVNDDDNSNDKDDVNDDVNDGDNDNINDNNNDDVNDDDISDDNDDDIEDDYHNAADDNNCTAVLLAAESDADFYLPAVSGSFQPTTGMSRWSQLWWQRWKWRQR